MKRLFTLLSFLLLSTEVIHAQCQQINPIIDNISVPPTTEVDPVTGETHVYYDICQGESITFSAHAEYPENNTNYTQSDATSTFTWTNNGSEPILGTEATYTFTEGGGYEIALLVEDSEGCLNTTLVKLYIRVSITPEINVTTNIDEVCPGVNTNVLAVADFSIGTEIVANIPWESPPCEDEFSEPLYLPDGNGAVYETQLQIACFQDGQTLINVEDLLSVDINIEHSYTGDLDIFLTAPNGVQISLFEQSGGSSWFGEATDGDDSATNPGIGYDYGWSMNPSWDGTMAQGLNQNSTGPTLNEDTYYPVDDFNELVGTELNGTWTLTVIDNISADNGWVFSWGISLNQDLIPAEWSFTNTILQTNWIPNANTTFTNGINMAVLSNVEGPHEYVFEIIDNFGCVYTDTSIIETLPEMALESVTVIADTCSQGLGSITIEGSENDLPNSYTWPTIFQNGPTATNLFGNTYPFTITNNSGCEVDGEATVPQVDIPLEITVEETTADGCEQGNGTMLVEVANGNEPYLYFWDNSTSNTNLGINLAAGDQSVTIFDANGCTGSATGFIESADGPEAIAESTPDICEYGQGEASITAFGGTPPYSYNWPSLLNNSSTVSNINSGTYPYIVTDNLDCEFEGTITVGQTNIALDVIVAQMTPDACAQGVGMLVVQPVSGQSPYTYDWVNSSSTTALGDNLYTGDQTVFITDAEGCTGEFTAFIDNIQGPSATASSTDDICTGELGTATVIATGGTPPYNYSWTGTGQMTATATGLAADTYPYIVTDDLGCTTTGQVTVDQTNMLVDLEVVTTTSDHCSQSEGLMIVQPQNGVPPYSYNWDGSNSTNNHGTNLLTGFQSVTVTDGFGCTGTATAMIDNVPPPSTDFDYFVDDCSSIMLLNNLTPDANNFQWLLDGEVFSYEHSPELDLIPGFYYDLTLVSSHNYCSDTLTQVVSSFSSRNYDHIEFPNVFTPNGDYENDEYKILGMLECDESTFRIYNRWGEEMFYTIHPRSKFWNGTKHGTPVDEGVYFYTLELEHATLKGTFSLFR